jgi:hypothetical protein
LVAKETLQVKEKKIAIQVPPHGSLGLLALGHKGLIAWRKAREEAEKDSKEGPGTDA